MNPTPEQVAQWAREAGMHIHKLDDDYCDAVGLPDGTICTVDNVGHTELQRLVTRAMAEQAEKDAKLCDARKAQSRNSLVRSGIAVVASDIRANAPKGTT